MRLLVLAPFLPDREASHGGGLYLGNLCRALADRAELGLLALAHGGETAARAADVAPWRWLAVQAPADRPSGSRKLLHQARMAVHWGLRGAPLLAAKHRHAGIPTLLTRALAEFRPDAVLVELAQMAQYLPLLAGVPTVFTDHEAGLPANSQTDLGAWADRRDQRLWRGYVQRFYPMAGLLQAVTREDADELSGLLGRTVATRPPTLPVPTQPVDPGAAPPRALFLGSYSHRPNPEAAERLVREVLPLLRARVPDAELWFAGTDTDRIAHLASEPGVHLRGFAPDLRELFAQCRVLLAPLYSGSGIRMKSLSALSYGLPVVTNALGARGCDAPAPARTIAEGAEQLAEATARFLLSPTEASDAARVAHRWAVENLAAEAVAEAQLTRIRELTR